MDPRRTVAVGLALLMIAVPPVAAKERSDTVKIDPGNFAPIQLQFDEGPAMRVGYEVTVTEGPRIDVFVLDNANYQKYRDNEDFQAHGASDLDTASAKQEFTLEEQGTWWIVLDHTNRGGAQPATVGAESATVRWTLNTNVDVKESVEQLPGPGIGAAGAVVAAALVLRRVR